MNLKEVSELRRRFRMDRNAISRIYGCFVNSSREIVSYIDESMGILPQDEAEKYLNLLKKALSGKLGKNLIDIIFSTEQVADSDEHRLLMALRDSQLKDGDIREEFYQKIINSLDLGDSNYLILLAHDTYDVPHKNKNDEMDADTSDAVFSYVVCCVCPVKERKAELGFFPGDNEFHSCAGQIVAAPELGFVFPAFDDRAANIYNALFYSRKADEIHQEVIDSVFHTTAPMSAAEQKKHSRMLSAKLWVMPAIWNWSSLSMTDSATRLNSIRRAMTLNRWNSPSVMRQKSCAITVWKRKRSLRSVIIALPSLVMEQR